MDGTARVRSPRRSRRAIVKKSTRVPHTEEGLTDYVCLRAKINFKSSWTRQILVVTKNIQHGIEMEIQHLSICFDSVPKTTKRELSNQAISLSEKFEKFAGAAARRLAFEHCEHCSGSMRTNYELETVRDDSLY
jgi:hypothetical protein